MAETMHATGGNIYLEIGMGADRQPGYGDSFPFRNGDAYVALDLHEPRGVEAIENPGPIVFDLQYYNDILRSGPCDIKTIGGAATKMAAIWNLHHYAEQKGICLIQMYGDGRELPFPDGSIDQILFRDVIGGSDYITDKANQQQLLLEAHRVIAPDGAVVICADRLTNFPATQSYLEREPGWRTEMLLTKWDKEWGYFRARTPNAVSYVLRPEPTNDPYTAHAE